MKLFWKKKDLPVTNETKEVDVVQLWYVRWQSRYSDYSFGVRQEMEAFTSAEAANEFAESLRAAFKLIKHTTGNSVSVVKN
jgi:hypothetical protein